MLSSTLLLVQRQKNLCDIYPEEVDGIGMEE